MDERRLETLIAEHGREVRAFARRRTDPATADDIAAEVFVTAWRRQDIPEGHELAWLYGVARRLLANERRAARRREGLLSSLRPLARPTRAHIAADQTGILEALASLRSSDQEILLLTAWEGLSAREAGLVLGCTERAVNTRLHRARRRLKAALESPTSPNVPILEKEATR